MAKETTDKFNVKIVWENADAKFHHFRFRGYSVNYQLEHVESDNQKDTYVVKIQHKNTDEKWRHYFSKGEWVKSYTPKLLKSTDLEDEFEVEVVYRGGQKAFEKSFHQLMWGDVTVNTTCLSSNTKNLGVLNPQGKAISESEKTVVEILKSYVIDTLNDAGFNKVSQVGKVEDKNDYAISVINGNEYFNYFTKGTKFICVHFPKYKVGITPVKDSQDHFYVVVSKPLTEYGRPCWRLSKNEYGLPGRVEVEKKGQWMRDVLHHKQYFLGDPTFAKTLGHFFKTVRDAYNVTASTT